MKLSPDLHKHTIAHELHAHTSFIHTETHNNNELNKKAIAAPHSRNQIELRKDTLVILRAIVLRNSERPRILHSC